MLTDVNFINIFPVHTKATFHSNYLLHNYSAYVGNNFYYDASYKFYFESRNFPWSEPSVYLPTKRFTTCSKPTVARLPVNNAQNFAWI